MVTVGAGAVVEHVEVPTFRSPEKRSAFAESSFGRTAFEMLGSLADLGRACNEPWLPPTFAALGY